MIIKAGQCVRNQELFGEGSRYVILRLYVCCFTLVAVTCHVTIAKRASRLGSLFLFLFCCFL